MGNNRDSSHFDDEVQHVTTFIWLSFVFVFGTAGNLLLFAAILRKGRITNVTNLFNLNLAVGDLIRIFVFIPVYLAHFEYHEFPPELGLVGCKVVFMIVQSSLTVSIITLMFMSMERYQAVVKPLKKQVSEKTWLFPDTAIFFFFRMSDLTFMLIKVCSSSDLLIKTFTEVVVPDLPDLHERLLGFCLNFLRSTVYLLNATQTLILNAPNFLKISIFKG